MVLSSPPARLDETFWGGTLETERTAFEATWGHCHTADGRGVLIALPYSDFMPCTLREKMFSLLKAMECANPGWNLYLALYDEPYHNEMDAQKTKMSGRGVLAHIRNIVIERYLQPAAHEYVLWVDADVVDYPPNLITLLHAANPGGVTAPTVLIEDSNSEAYHSRCRHGICGGKAQTERHYQFYDRAAFIVAGTNISTNPSFPGNAQAFPPYLGDPQMWDEAKARTPSVIDCTRLLCFSAATADFIIMFILKSTIISHIIEHLPTYTSADKSQRLSYGAQVRVLEQCTCCPQQFINPPPRTSQRRLPNTFL